MKLTDSINFRLVTYMLLPCAAVQAVVIAAQHGHAAYSVSENGPIEWTQFAVLMISGSILLARAYKTTTPQLSRLMAAFPIMAAVRELDKVFDRRIFDGSWQLTVFAILGLTAWYISRHSKKIADQLTTFLRESSSGLMLAAMLIILGISRIAGQQTFWEAVMGENHLTVVGRLVEETLEITGYLILAAAAVEKTFFNLPLSLQNELAEKETIQQRNLIPRKQAG
ncbi:hypothetical protein STSP2_03098 [Anaerohalosphaera lusitana]|uniref:Uncharacterized protein n=1 Tax=Anaerohalosphaera lusitana TaxID=1936003 RepID=A0A1U9NQA2_9BACT|nr:hypothetical protein [Anaerohalosphaera lusitana]AQT69898.1 hypothetical protein STSP2_03098 [Anaerohalosphaera lusitana]